MRNLMELGEALRAVAIAVREELDFSLEETRPCYCLGPLCI